MKKTVLILSIVLSMINAQDKIRLMTEIFPPFQYKDHGELIGISTEIVQAIQKEVKTYNKIKVYPWTRGVKIVEKRNNSAIFSMLRTPKREKTYKWVGPLTSMKLVFFKKKGSNIILNSIEDAKKVGKIGVTKKVANYEMLKSKGFTNLDVLTSGQDEKNILKLIKGRIDLWPTLMMAGLYNAKKMGLSGEIVPIENIIAFEGDMYIAFNKNTNDNIIKSWQKALNKLKSKKEISKIIRKYR